MKSALFDPTKGNPSLQEALVLANEIYSLHEAGKDYSGNLKRLGRIAGRPIGTYTVHAAFGSIEPSTFARKQLIDWNALPNDLLHEEMLELVEHICNGSGDEFQSEYWLECLRINTADDRISDLLFCPGEYFNDGNDSRVMSPAEILNTALEAKR